MDISGGWCPGNCIKAIIYIQISLPEHYERIQVWTGLLLQQYGLLGIAFGLLGLIMFRMPLRVNALTLWLATVSFDFALLYGSVNSYVHLIPMFLSFAICFGLGVAGLVHLINQRSSFLGLGFGLLLIGYFAGRLHRLGLLMHLMIFGQNILAS